VHAGDSVKLGRASADAAVSAVWVALRVAKRESARVAALS
jgi:hypothetical protein